MTTLRSRLWKFLSLLADFVNRIAQHVLGQLIGDLIRRCLDDD